jgi:hypothetical protein
VWHCYWQRIQVPFVGGGLPRLRSALLSLIVVGVVVGGGVELVGGESADR